MTVSKTENLGILAHPQVVWHNSRGRADALGGNTLYFWVFSRRLGGNTNFNWNDYYSDMLDKQSFKEGD